MNSALTRPQSLQELYKTYFSFASRFKFTDLLRNYIQNEEWKDKSQQPVWDLLSKISDDIGAVLTDDIVNYTRNVVDINTCKVPQLIEHAQMLSYGLENLKNSYAFLPKRIQLLVDVFSINPEYLIGNHQNHILSDEVIKEILVYIRENVKDRTPFTNEDVVDRLIVDPHGLTDATTYRNFVTTLFYTSMVQALSATYSSDDDEDGDKTPIAFNLLWEERKNQQNILSRLDEYKSWVDRYIWNEIEYPLNDSGMSNTIYDLVERLKSQKQMSGKFNPFKVADHIYFNGLNPTNQLSDSELSLVQMVLDYHAKTKYDYESQQFVDDLSTQYAYYRELEWCEYVKMVMYVMNNINLFKMNNLTYYEPSENKFIQTGADSSDCIRVVGIFNEGGQSGSIVDNGSGVALNHEMILRVAKFFCDYVFHVQAVRENMKTIAQKHAMRGTGALLVHIVNDYLIKELPVVRDMAMEGSDVQLKFGWEVDKQFMNYGNVKVLEYEDDNEYFNIEPVKDVRFTAGTNSRYWEQLDGMGYDDTLGVLTKGQIRDFYRNVLGMGRLQPKKPRDYDDVCDFLVDLFKIGANPVEWRTEEGEFYNPIDDIINKSEEDYGYTKAERLEVQSNTELRRNQERQFLQYRGGTNDIIGESIYDLTNSSIFYWKNVDYSSHMLHPFMYNLKLWNKLNNIIINGYKDYLNVDLIEYLSSKTKFDEIFGKFGEGRNFWKYNIMDLTGYTTRYEAAIKDEHLDDGNNTASQLTGYDGLFYPDAAEEFLRLYRQTLDSDGNENAKLLALDSSFFVGSVKVYGQDGKCHWEDGAEIGNEGCFIKGEQEFLAQIHSIYWQLEKTVLVEPVEGKTNVFRKVSEEDSFYTRWYSHLNYTRSEYQKIAMQLWYWRGRIDELISTEYPITRYCLDIQGNSLVMVSTFKPGEEETSPYLIDLAIAQEGVQQNRSGNLNTHVSFCDNSLKKPSELWIRWKSNPIALPAFDVDYDKSVGFAEFDMRYRDGQAIELGQITHTNNDCNENFKVVVAKWRETYGNLVKGNRLPVFFDMEQSANVLALASWYSIKQVDDDGVVQLDEYGNEKAVTCCSKNPLHVLSYERSGTGVFDYNLTQYSSTQDFSTQQVLLGWLFDAYVYCQANGALLIPLYRFDCSDGQDGAEDEMQKLKQTLELNMFLVPAQSLKTGNFVAEDRIIQLDGITIDLNQMVDFGQDNRKHMFDHPVKVCRNTNVVFSVRDDGGFNKLRCAFLGTFVKMDGVSDEDIISRNGNYTTTSCKTSSCGALTRYEFDSQSTTDLALTKGSYFREDDSWVETDSSRSRWTAEVSSRSDRKYIDEHVAPNPEPTDEKPWESKFNSYDSNDKFVFIVDFGTSIDLKGVFRTGWRNNISSHSYNILGDAGYIPHFAYQSLVKYDGKDGGTAYTWRNKYLQGKDHMQFELLGLDDKGLTEEFETMQKMVVDDITDDCRTLLCPAKLMDDIYRIWCENRGVRRRLFPGEDDPYGYKTKYDSHFANEYMDYSNPELDFGSKNVIDWNISDGCGLRGLDDQLVVEHDRNGRKMWFGPDGNIAYEKTTDEGETIYVDSDGREVDDIDGYSTRVVDDGLFYIDLPREVAQSLGADDEENVDEFKKVLDEYYVCVIRTEDGQILNEKRYILPPTQLSEFFFGMGDKDGFMKCSLSPYQTSLVQDNHFVPTQVIFTGTQNPFSYDNDGNRIYSKAEELQYGNCIKGVDSIELKIEIESVTDEFQFQYDKKGNIVAEERLSAGSTADGGSIIVNPTYTKVVRKKIRPILRFRKDSAGQGGLLGRIQSNTTKISAGQVTVVLSHRNMDNIAKYHILNKSSNLYYNGTLPKNGQNQLKYSDFKFDQTVRLEYDTTASEWVSVERGSDGQPLLQFADVNGDASSYDPNGDPVPPYYVTSGGKTWYLEQSKLVPRDEVASFKKDDKVQGTPEIADCKPGDYCHVSFNENGNEYPIQTKGNFIYAHRVKSMPEKYADYLYVKRGSLAFKVSEESESFADAMSMIPPFHIDRVTRNKLKDLNNAQVLSEYSTFIHQSENPERVNVCNNFNPLVADVVLNYGVEQKELHAVDDWNADELVAAKDDEPKVICTEKWVNDWTKQTQTPSEVTHKLIELDNHNSTTRLRLQLEEGEIDDYLKIYTNYVRVDDGHGDFHYDLYFNIQNLFNSPFEYISSVTKQPNVLILEDSYLYLTGDKYKKVYDSANESYHNEIDDDKVDRIKQGGQLTIYGQVKTYSDDRLSDVKTIKLFSYQVYNVSDDKPKFLIEKTYDVTKTVLTNQISNQVGIEFSDVLWTIEEDKFKYEQGGNPPYDTDSFRVLDEDVLVVQPIHIKYNWNRDDDYRIKQISFDIMSDIIDFRHTPELCEYWIQARTLRNGEDHNSPYYDHWSDRHMKLEFNETTHIPRLTLTYDPLSGFNFETIYLRWRLPNGCRIMDTTDRLGGYVFSSTAQNVEVDCNNAGVTPLIDVTIGHVVVRVPEPGKMYLGLEHSTTKRMNGFVLTGLADAMLNAIQNAISEDEIKTVVKNRGKTKLN